MFRYVKTQQGYVMLLVLIFMQIFALFSFFGLSSASIAIKSQQQRWTSDKILWNAESVLRLLEKQIMQEGLTCRINVIEPAALTLKPISWWKRFACSGNLAAFRYYYAIEYLGKDSCASIGNLHRQSSNPKYYRITLFALPAKLKGTKIILQSTVAKASNGTPTCEEGKVHFVRAGRQMIRRL